MTTIELIEDQAGFEKLRWDWTELLESSAANDLFLTWEWLHTWWKHLSEDRRLSIIAVRCDGRLAAIAPLTLRPRRWVRLLPFRSIEFLGTGSVGSDYLDVIIRRGKERDVLETLAGYLADQRFMLELTQIKREASFAVGLAAPLEQRGWSRSEAKTDICPYINLSGQSWLSYLAGLGPEHRYNFQRRLRNLTKQFDVRFEPAVSEEQRAKALSVLVELHRMRWRDRGGSNAFHTSGLVSFHEEVSRLALERDWLRLFVLRLDGKPAAALYGFKYRRTFYFYQSGFDPVYGKHGVGLVIMGLAIKSAIEEGAEEYDLLHGDEPYKFHWARAARELGRLELYPPGARGMLYKGTHEISRVTRKMVRRLLPKTLADRIATGRGLSLGNGWYAAQPR